RRLREDDRQASGRRLDVEELSRDRGRVRAHEPGTPGLAFELLQTVVKLAEQRLQAPLRVRGDALKLGSPVAHVRPSLLGLGRAARWPAPPGGRAGSG